MSVVLPVGHHDKSNIRNLKGLVIFEEFRTFLTQPFRAEVAFIVKGVLSEQINGSYGKCCLKKSSDF